MTYDAMDIILDIRLQMERLEQKGIEPSEIFVSQPILEILERDYRERTGERQQPEILQDEADPFKFTAVLPDRLFIYRRFMGLFIYPIGRTDYFVRVAGKI